MDSGHSDRESQGEHRERPRSRMSATPPLPLSGRGNLQSANGRVPPLESSRPISTILSQTPDTVIGEFVNIQGELSFKNLLRIDGYFKGKLKSTGSLIVGSKGFLEGDVLDMNELVCDGVIIGNIRVKRAVLRSHAVIKGNITARKLNVGEKVSIEGQVTVNRKQPEAFPSIEELKAGLAERFGVNQGKQGSDSKKKEGEGKKKEGEKEGEGKQQGKEPEKDAKEPVEVPDSSEKEEEKPKEEDSAEGGKKEEPAEKAAEPEDDAENK